MVRSHEANVAQWAMSRIEPSTKPFAESGMRRLTSQGDTLFSYGTHFPVMQALRRRGQVHAWLLNGDTWSGGWSMTSAHQGAARHIANRYEDTLGMKHVIIPWSVMDAAGIDTRTVQIIDVSEDWVEARTEEFEAEPPNSYWSYETAVIQGTGVRVNQRTGEVFQHGWNVGMTAYLSDPPGKPKYGDYITLGADRDEREAQYRRFEAANQRWDSEWERVPTVSKKTGHRNLILDRRSHQMLEQYVREDGTIGSRYTWHRHWLGESLIKARVPYTAAIRCPDCRGTGLHPHAEPLPGAEGPMTYRQHLIWERWYVEGQDENRHSIGSRIEERCETCLGRRRVTATKTRMAYFLSGFDHNEPRPSYFFTELPPKARPKTIAEAYESLKPATVRLAEEMGRDVNRQGEWFAIPMPDLTLRELKRAGGEHRKRNDLVKIGWGNRGRFISPGCALGGSNHEAQEVVVLSGVTYARGFVKHVPENRRPDHVPMQLGKTWHLMVPNLTPVGR